MASISIVLKAVDQYSGVITGLNQGFELAAKAVDALKWTADAAFSAIASGAELISKGGAFREQESQFKNLAESYSQNADEIVDAIKRISNNSVNLSDAIKIGTKAIVTGLSGPEIESTLKFVKKFTEATGEDFNAMSEKVFKALSGDKAGVLKQMGLFVGETSKASEIVSQMEDKLSLFGEAAFNAGDNFGALATAQDDFVTKIGAAINDVPILADVLNGVTSSVIDFVSSFDTRPITFFFEFSGRVLKALLNAFDATFGDIARTVYNTFKSLSTEQGLNLFAQSVIDTIKEVGPFFLNLGELAFFAATTVVKAAGFIAEGWGNLYAFLKTNALAAAEFIGKIFVGVFTSISKSINTFIASYPDVSNLIPGLDGLVNGLSSTEDELYKNLNAIQDWKDEAASEENIGTFIAQLGEDIQSTAKTLEEKGKAAFDSFANNAQRSIDSIVIPDFTPVKVDSARTDEQIKNIKEIADAQRNYSEELASEKESKKEANKLQKEQLKIIQEQSKAEREADKQSKDAEKDLRDRLRDIKDLKDKIANTSLNTKDAELLKLKLDPFAIKNLEAEEKQIQDILGKIDSAEAKERGKRVAETLKAVQGLGSGIENELNKTGGKLGAALRTGKLDVNVNLKSPLEKDITDTIARTNWPAELRALGEFLLRFIITKARGERVPLTVSTF